MTDKERFAAQTTLMFMLLTLLALIFGLILGGMSH